MLRVGLWNFQNPLKNRVGVQNPRSPCLAQYNLLKKQLMSGPFVDPKKLVHVFLYDIFVLYFGMIS